MNKNLIKLSCLVLSCLVMSTLQSVARTFTCSQETCDGTISDDTITGTNKKNIIHGLAGADTIHALLGDDNLYGGDGDDILNGGKGINFLVGQSGNDKLSGDKGDDDLYGGYGQDTLYGGQGSDNFLFYKIDSPANAPDTITDFKNALDTIELGISEEFDRKTLTLTKVTGGYALKSNDTINNFSLIIKTRDTNLTLETIKIIYN